MFCSMIGLLVLTEGNARVNFYHPVLGYKALNFFCVKFDRVKFCLFNWIVWDYSEHTFLPKKFHQLFCRCKIP